MVVGVQRAPKVDAHAHGPVARARAFPFPRYPQHPPPLPSRPPIHRLPPALTPPPHQTFVAYEIADLSLGFQNFLVWDGSLAWMADFAEIMVGLWEFGLSIFRWVEFPSVDFTCGGAESSVQLLMNLVILLLIFFITETRLFLLIKLTIIEGWFFAFNRRSVERDPS